MYNLLGVLYLQLRTYMYMYISKEYKYERKSYEVVRLDGWIQISSVVLPTKFKIRYFGTSPLVGTDRYHANRMSRMGQDSVARAHDARRPLDAFES